MALIVYSMASC